MSTYQTISLSKPTGDNKIPTSALTYMRTRLRQRFYSMVIEEFMRSGISQADLARRLDKDPRIIHRWLSSPENLRISTLSDLVFGINGGEPSNHIDHPLDAAPGNTTLPTWLAEALDQKQFGYSSPSETSSSTPSNFVELRVKSDEQIA